jgi:hypothetical protein
MYTLPASQEGWVLDFKMKSAVAQRLNDSVAYQFNQSFIQSFLY